MKEQVIRLMKRVGSVERGFTLVELLVVVAIVVALAAASVTSVIRFAGKGETGAQAAESEALQAAMDTMLADNSITAVTGRVGPATSTNDFTSLPVEGPLVDYMRDNPTTYFYCWDTTGKITRQDAASAACP
ncbi:MAG: prepilin-type N-terminal cleavage/methylation domain-containing protein [SAR202 cluster bacterium]|nr:prepilin-type N-terminal cleavage/methylation domain-containing protein [SAR202 cluster bacterium]